MSRSLKDYCPERGDICFVDLDPRAGIEQSKRRPALVVSDSHFNKRIGLAFACPITSTPARHGFHIKLEDHLKTKGVVMREQQKSVDYIARNAAFVEKAPDSLITIVSDILKQIIDGSQD